MATVTSTNTPLRVGVLLVGKEVQFIDVSAVDLLGMCTPGFLQACDVPGALLAKAHVVEFLYIAESGVGTHVNLTGGAKVLVTHSFEDAGKLDYLIVPGPEPTYRASPAELDFIRTQFSGVRALLTVCTGILPVTQSGVLSGRRATAPRGILAELRKIASDVQWTEKRWEVDTEGKVWTSGTITNGLDLVAAFIRETFAPELAETICGIADVGDRGQLYERK